MRLAGRPVAVVVATRTEASAARAVLGGPAVVRVGVGAVSGARLPPGVALVSVGLCGGLGERLRTGDAVIPDEVGTRGGARFGCDPALVHALRAGAAELGVAAGGGALLTSERIVAGDGRAAAAAEGWAAVDMETAHLAGAGVPVAAVRVVLDAPGAELDPAWERPIAALLRPRLWGEARRLAVTAPRLARLAARIVGAAADLEVASGRPSLPGS